MTPIEFKLDDDFLEDLFLKDDKESMRLLIEKVINAILKAEATEQIGASRYARSEGRITYRNGYRNRNLNSSDGTFHLQVPKLRNGTFSTQLFARYQRSERALMLAMMEMVLQGVSTRKVAKITEELCGTQFSAQTVSNLCKDLDEGVEAFRNRPLTGRYRYIIADATYLKMHEENHGKVISVGLFIVLGVNEEGKREVLGFDVFDKESEARWKEMFQSLKDRGLEGVELVTSDAHCGIQNAIQEKFPGSAWQRCQTHFSRNILDACPNHLMPELKRELRDMYEAPSLEECKRRRDLILEKYEDLVPKAMKILDEWWTDITAVYSLPPSLRKKLRTSNAVERVNAEQKKRSSVLRIFTNEASILRLMGSILIEMHEKWSERVYMNLTGLRNWEGEESSFNR